MQCIILAGSLSIFCGRSHPRYDHVDRHVPDYVREITKHNIWYYRDRCNVPRGPCPLPVLRECWVQVQHCCRPLPRPGPRPLRRLHCPLGCLLASHRLGPSYCDVPTASGHQQKCCSWKAWSACWAAGLADLP